MFDFLILAKLELLQLLKVTKVLIKLGTNTGHSGIRIVHGANTTRTLFRLGKGGSFR